jgi:PadR family transcriptional regulator AphA
VPRRTSTTANALLGLMALRPEWSTWDLQKQLQRNLRYFWPRAESRVYDELGALADRGWAKRKRTLIGKRQRTTYSITARGRKHLDAWLATPPKATTLECEPLLRVFLGKLGSAAEMRTAVEQVRADADAILAIGRTVGDEYRSGTAPFQDHVEVRAFIFDFLSHYALMLRAWADRTDTALERWEQQSTRRRERTAISLIERSMDEFPNEDRT